MLRAAGLDKHRKETQPGPSRRKVPTVLRDPSTLWTTPELADRLDRTGVKGHGLSTLDDNLEQYREILREVGNPSRIHYRKMWSATIRGALPWQAQGFASLRTLRPDEYRLDLSQCSLFPLEPPQSDAEGQWNKY